MFDKHCCGKGADFMHNKIMDLIQYSFGAVPLEVFQKL
jgi:hypothetical protein